MTPKKEEIVVALIGNPNCGKSSVFNWLTGLNQKVGNFPGVTVDKKSGKAKVDERVIKVIDLPGTYSIYPKSLDEIIVTELLLNSNEVDHPDAAIVVLDASNLKRNLYLLTQIIDLKIPFTIALNMMDLANKEGLQLDPEKLSHHFGCDVVLTNGQNGEGVEKLLPIVLKSLERGVHQSVESIGVDASEEIIQEASQCFPDFSPFKVSLIVNHYESLHFLSAEELTFLENLNKKHKPSSSKNQLKEIGKRYKYINDVVDKFSSTKKKINERNFSDKLDVWFTHPVWGWLIFLFIFFLLFQAVFTIASYPADWIDQGMGALITWTKSVIPDGRLSDFVAGGILTGINGIVVFIPQIMILFGLITILEDTGYMARVSFINDKLLSRFGMNGKSVVPIVGGFACAVPSIMAARSIPNQRQRLITIFITPLMSCSARLPVYVFLIAFLVEEKYLFGFINLQGLYMVGLYLLGVVMSIFISGLLNWFLRKDKSGIFTLEMPTFKSPRWKNVLMSMVNSAKTFINEAGKIILIVSMVLWVLMSFGPGDDLLNVDLKYDLLIEESLDHNAKNHELARSSEKLEKSYAGILGKVIEPVIKPLGFDWRTGIALLTSFAAREVFVGTMANIYHVDSDSDNTIQELQKRLMNQNDPETGQPYLSYATAWSLIIFYVFALQCASTIAIVRKETGGWKWPIIQFTAFTALAWISSYITFAIVS